MSEGVSSWVGLLEISPEQADQFQRLAVALETTPPAILAHILRRVLHFERDLKNHGLPGFRDWLVPDHDPPSEHRTTAGFSAEAWVEVFGISLAEARMFARLALELKLSPATVIAMMMAATVQQDGPFGGTRITAMREWMTAPEILHGIAKFALRALPLRLRPSHFMWPADKAFPWSADDCMAAVIGYEVKWPGDFGDFSDLLRGKWEMSDGYAILYQT